ATTRFLPSTGGTWASTNPGIATITNGGIVTGISTGNVKFLYTNSFTGCTSDSSIAITVLPGTEVSVTGSNPVCAGSTTTLSPTTGGMWISNQPSIASVTNTGIATALQQGTATFTFVNYQTGCSSMPTQPVTINP